MKDNKILICDDERGVRESLKLILSDKYDLAFAENGNEAIDALRESPDIRAILLDIKMPGINGIEALRHIRSRNNDIPVIIITGYQSVEAASASLNTGATHYITKPFESKAVTDTLKKALS